MSAGKRPVRAHVSLALRPDQMRRLETIQRWAETDPDVAGLTTRRVGLQTAVLYAIRLAEKNLPGHVGGKQG